MLRTGDWKRTFLPAGIVMFCLAMSIASKAESVPEFETETEMILETEMIAETETEAETTAEAETETEMITEMESEAGNVVLSQYRGLIFTIKDPKDRALQEEIVTEYLLKTCTADPLPEEQLREETDKIRAWYQELASFYDMDLYEFIDTCYGIDADAFDEQTRETAKAGLARKLIFEAVAETENLEYSTDTLEQAVLDFLIDVNEFETSEETSSEEAIFEEPDFESDEESLLPQEALAVDSSRILSEGEQRPMTLHERLAALEQELGIDGVGKSTMERVESIKKDLDMETQQYSIWAMLDEVEARMYGPYVDAGTGQAAADSAIDKAGAEGVPGMAAGDAVEPAAEGVPGAADADDVPEPGQADAAGTEPGEAETPWTEIGQTETSGTGPGQAETPGTELVEYKDGTTVYHVQQALTALGFDCEKSDGLLGTKTIRAIMEFEASTGLPVDGRITDALLDALQLKKPGE